MIVLSLVLPMLVLPVILFAGRFMEERRERQLAERAYSYAIIGPRAGEARALIADALTLRSPDLDRALFREVATGDAASALDSRTLDFYVEVSSVTELLRRVSAPQNPERVDPEERLRALPGDLLALSLVFRGDRDQSEAGADRFGARLREARLRRRWEVLSRAGFTLAQEDVMPVEPVNLAADTQVAGLALGRFATALLTLFLFMGGAVVAQDTLAGEKERGTLETLLTTAASRGEIVAAKLLLVLTVAIVVTTIQVGNLLAYAHLQVIASAAQLADVVTPLLAGGLLVFLLPLAALISAALLLVSGYAKSYREAQLSFMPVLLLSAALALAAVLPGVSLRSAIVVVPFANISVGVRELLVGRIDWPFLITAWLVTAGSAAWLMRMAERALSSERLIVPSVAEVGTRMGRPAVTPGGLVTWFAGLWAIAVLVSLNLGPAFDIRGQLLINLVGIFLGGSWLFIRRYRLPVRETLLLNRVPWQVWVGVICGVPAAQVASIGVARLANLVIPVPQEILDSFSQYLIPEEVNFWQLFLVLTLLPGVCEEIAFRGVLLQSVRRFVRPAAAVTIVGFTFGAFHFDLFRLFPTALLGVILAAVTMLTGSIFPAMAWHAMHNALALVVARFGVSLALLSPGVHAAAAAILLLSFWILWRSRPLTSQGLRT